MPDVGLTLNKRVWNLFETAGFETKPNSDNDAEEEVMLAGGKRRTLDLSATIPDLKVKIIGENTVSRRLGEPVTTYVNDMKALMDVSNANAGLLVYARFEPSEADRKYAERKGVKIWEEQELLYYEKLVETIGKHAKYEIIHSFGLDTAEQRAEHSVLALQFNQPTSAGAVGLYLFTMPPKDLLRTAAVLRKAQGSAAAYQRILNKKRLPKIRDFVTGPNAILPTNIILALTDYVKWELLPKEDLRDSRGESFNLTHRDYALGLLRIPMKYASLELIDGQHRLFGFIDADEATLEHFNLVVLGIKGLLPEQKSGTFVAINDNFRRVDPNLVAYLKFTSDERECQANPEKMAIKIVYELNKTTPFKGKIRMLDFPSEIITLKGFSGYDLRGLVGPRGWLRKHYENNSEQYVSVLREFFGLLKSSFPVQWADQRKYIIFTNRGVSAFLKLLRSILRTEKRPLDKPTITKYLQALKSAKHDSDWEITKLRSSYIGSKGWSDFHRDLVEAIRKKYPDFKR